MEELSDHKKEMDELFECYNSIYDENIKIRKEIDLLKKERFGYKMRQEDEYGYCSDRK